MLKLGHHALFSQYSVVAQKIYLNRYTKTKFRKKIHSSSSTSAIDAIFKNNHIQNTNVNWNKTYFKSINQTFEQRRLISKHTRICIKHSNCKKWNSNKICLGTPCYAI